MTKSTRWRLCLVVFFILLSGLYLAPTLTDNLPAWWKGAMPQEKINLGLDLQGGSHLVLEVQKQAAVESYLERAAAQIEEALQSGDTPVKRIAREGADRLRILLYDPAAAEIAGKLVGDKLPDLDVSAPTESGGFVSLDLQLGQSAVQEIGNRAVVQALETIRNRVGQFGVAEPIIQRQGENHIVVQLPGIKDPQRAIELIGKMALLEFKLAMRWPIPAIRLPFRRRCRFLKRSGPVQMYLLAPARVTEPVAKIILKVPHQREDESI